MLLSVIIPTRNRAGYLAGALESITRQSYPQHLFEVIVVDNGSADNTKVVCYTYLKRLANLRYYYDATPGLHVGRHLGMRQARSDILVYADDDIEAFPTWLEAIAESFQDSEVVLVGGKNLPKFKCEPPDWILKMWEADKHGNRILGYLSILDLGDEKKQINPHHVFGCNFSIRKNLLIEAGGFHPDAMPQELIKYRGDGETHLSRYIKARQFTTLYHPKASVYHIVTQNRMTMDYFYTRAFNQGVSDSYSQIRSGVIKRSIKENYYRLIKTLSHARYGARILLVRIAYLKGFQFHNNQARIDESLLEWVIKPTYYN